MITTFNKPKTTADTTEAIQAQVWFLYDDEEFEFTPEYTKGCDVNYRKLSDQEVFAAASIDANSSCAPIGVASIIFFVMALVFNGAGLNAAYGIFMIIAMALILWLAWGTCIKPLMTGAETLPFASILPTVKEANARRKNLAARAKTIKATE